MLSPPEYITQIKMSGSDRGTSLFSAAARSSGNQQESKGLDVLAQEDIIREQAKKAHELFQSIYDELDDRDADLKDGLSYLDLKNDTLLSYMIDVCNVMLIKLSNKSIENHQSVERCVEYRVILEKIKSIDQKLSYQLNKLITMPENASEEGGVDIKNLDVDIDSNSEDSDEPEQTSSRLEESDNDDSAEEDEEDGDRLSVSSGDEEEGEDGPDHSALVKEKSAKKQGRPAKKPVGIYKPPKLRSVAYVEKDRHRDHEDFYGDDYNDEIVEPTTIGGRSEIDRERTEFEEEHYTRLRDENPKKAKRKLKTKEYRKKNRKRRRK